LALTTTMGKLNIAHHKSYHPYRRDNIERVRRDEEEAAAKEAKAEGRVLLADSEARIDLLRGKAGLGGGKNKGKGKEKETIEDIIGADGNVGSLVGSGGHINFFEDLEQVRYPSLPTLLCIEPKTVLNTPFHEIQKGRSHRNGPRRAPCSIC
jgi:hypothetical protein